MGNEAAIVLVLIHGFIYLECFRICLLEIKFEHLNGRFMIFLLFIFNFLFIVFEKNVFVNSLLFLVSHLFRNIFKNYIQVLEIKNISTSVNDYLYIYT